MWRRRCSRNNPQLSISSPRLAMHQAGWNSGSGKLACPLRAEDAPLGERQFRPGRTDDVIRSGLVNGAEGESWCGNTFRYVDLTPRDAAPMLSAGALGGTAT